MILLYNNKEYTGRTATEIVCAVRHDFPDYKEQNGPVKCFLEWSLARMADKIPQRELDVSTDLPDEAVAFNYLCLLDRYDGGRLIA